MVKPEVAILLPCMNSMPYLKVTIKCLFESTKFPFHLILIESESTDGTAKFCDDLAKEKDNVEVYHIPKKGLPNAINFGIEKARDLDVYITQDDVIHYRLLGRDWLAEMHFLAKNDKKIGMVTSLGGYGISGPSYVEGMRWVGTWNLYLPRTTINTIGTFDEKMGPGDDLDYSYRCMKKDLGISIIDYWVQHHRLTDHGAVDSEEVKKQMSDYFKNKWKKELKEEK